MFENIMIVFQCRRLVMLLMNGFTIGHSSFFERYNSENCFVYL